jgi:hypothetical protein
MRSLQGHGYVGSGGYAAELAAARPRVTRGSRLKASGLRLAAAIVLLLAACTPTGPRNTGVYLLIDTSGTYNQEVRKAEQIILYLLGKMGSSDSFAVARINTASFTEQNIIAKATFDDRPSAANQQKRSFAGRVQQFVDDSRSSPYTDITGGVLQAIEFLNEKGSGRKEILIFSDMKEDLAKGFVRDLPLDLRGFDVVALNVTKLRSDNVDPREYLGRLDAWRERVEKSGGRWRVINDLENMDALL